MPFKIYTRVDENGSWHPVIDMKASRTKKIDRIFFTEDSAKYFVQKEITAEEKNIRIVEIDDG